MNTSLRILTLSQAAKRVGGTLLNSSRPQEIRVHSVVSSSSRAEPGSLFVACKGTAIDGHDFIDKAFSAGSIAAVVEDPEKLEGRPGVVVPNSQKALSRLCAHFSGDPSKELTTVGITGTNGKTTVHWMLHHALDRLEMPSIRIGSLGIATADGIERSHKVTTPDGGRILLTTPGAQEIHEALRIAVDSGIEACVLETSSHSLAQHRVSDVWFDATVFTNLTPDHLDYHPDMESYFQAKVSLFEQLSAQTIPGASGPGAATINTDCPYGRLLVEKAETMGLAVFTFGSGPGATVRIRDFRQELHQSVLELTYSSRSHRITTAFIGDYNASNMAAAFATLVSLGFGPEPSASALSQVPPVPGRLESVGTKDIAVLVDYAHTGVGLRSVLSAVKGFVENDLWVVFGCGGRKDPGKRAAMGLAAKELADRIVLTSDNPRDEDPAQIIDHILASGCTPELIELDRGRAIRQALERAVKGDVVVLAGKGHEDYQIIAGETFHFSDQEQVRKCREEGLLRR